MPLVGSFALCSFLAGPLVAQNDNAQKIDDIFQSVNRPGTPGAAVAVIEHGKVAYEKGYGLANLEYNIPITPDTVFHVASVSKQFTAMAVVLLERDGKLSIDDDVRKYLPELPEYGHKITLRNLLQHTSGIRDQWETLATAGWSLEDVITQDQILRMLFRQKELNFPPGTSFLYSNSGFTLLAEIVKRVSGERLPNFCNERIFRQLGMTHTHFHLDHHQIVPGRAYSYRSRPAGFENAPLNYATVGATSLITTAGDLVKWLDNFRDPKVGGPAAIARMEEEGVLTDGKKTGYALGISVGSFRGLRRLEHSGGDAGFRSEVVWFPDQELGVAVVSNLGSFNPSQAANRVVELYRGAKLEAPQQPNAPPTGNSLEDARAVPFIQPAPEKLAQYAGVYWSDELETQYTILVRAGGLVALNSHHGELPLTATATDQFRSTMSFFTDVKFIRDDNGRVTALTVGGGRVTAIRFQKKAEP
jgi:CubicO group peptidase (beta-lactamase class C family)